MLYLSVSREKMVQSEAGFAPVAIFVQRIEGFEHI